MGDAAIVGAAGGENDDDSLMVPGTNIGREKERERERERERGERERERRNAAATL